MMRLRNLHRPADRKRDEASATGAEQKKVNFAYSSAHCDEVRWWGKKTGDMQLIDAMDEHY